MLKLTVTKNFDLDKLDFDWSKTLNNMAGVVKKDIYRGIEIGMFDGKVLKPLKNDPPPGFSTIRSKTRKGYRKPMTALVATGSMRKLLTDRATKRKQEVKIYPGKNQAYPGKSVTRMDVGRFHQEGDGVPRREWFGISRKARETILDLAEMKMKQMKKSIKTRKKIIAG